MGKVAPNTRQITVIHKVIKCEILGCSLIKKTIVHIVATRNRKSFTYNIAIMLQWN